MALALAVVLAGVQARAQDVVDDPAAARAGAYTLDGRRATLAIRVPYLGGLSTGVVRFDRLTGDFDYDPADWRATRVDIVVDPKSASSRDGVLGRRVAGALEPGRYPTIRFRSTHLSSDAAGRGRLTGALTLHGVTRPVTLDIVFKGGADDRLGFSGRGRVKRSDFGVTAARPFVGDMLDLAFEVEFVRR